jgi:DNA-binding MarR family transcriptional regulator
MLTELFTSRTRIHLFLKLFLNPGISCYLRELAREFNLTPNALKEELDNLSQAGYLGNPYSTRPIRTIPSSRKSIPS